MPRLLPLLLLLSAPPPAADPPKAKDPGKGTSFAFLVVGAGYNKAELKPITGEETVNDVVEFRKALLATGFKDEHIVLMHDRRTDTQGRYLPEYAKIVKELDLFLDGLTVDDTVVVVLSGHGVHFKGDKFGYYCPIDAKLSTKQNLLPMDGDGGLFPQLEKCKAGRKLLIANACRNDPEANASLAGPKYETVDEYPESAPKGVAAIYSCDVGQKSYFDPDRKRSLFFLHLTDAWVKEGATLEGVFEATRANTKADAAKTFGEKQFPVVKRKYEGEWKVSVAVPAVRPPELKAVVPADPKVPKPADMPARTPPAEAPKGLTAANKKTLADLSAFMGYKSGAEWVYEMGNKEVMVVAQPIDDEGRTWKLTTHENGRQVATEEVGLFQEGVYRTRVNGVAVLPPMIVLPADRGVDVTMKFESKAGSADIQGQYSFESKLTPRNLPVGDVKCLRTAIEGTNNGVAMTISGYYVEGRGIVELHLSMQGTDGTPLLLKKFTPGK